VAYSENPKGPWVPMSTMTGIFKNKRKPHPQPHQRIYFMHDPANMTIPGPSIVAEDEPLPPPPHQPMMYKLPTS
jgi:hypothetical protein